MKSYFQAKALSSIQLPSLHTPEINLGVGASLGHPHLTNWLQIGGFSWLRFDNLLDQLPDIRKVLYLWYSFFTGEKDPNPWPAKRRNTYDEVWKGLYGKLLVFFRGVRRITLLYMDGNCAWSWEYCWPGRLPSASGCRLLMGVSLCQHGWLSHEPWGWAQSFAFLLKSWAAVREFKAPVL